MRPAPALTARFAMTIFTRRATRSLAALVAAVSGTHVAVGQSTPAPPVAITQKAEPPTRAPAGEPPAEAPLISSMRVLTGRLLSWRPFRAKTTEVVETISLRPTSEELQRLQSGQASLVEVAAAKLKADEAAVPARRAAIRYLASVRC